MRKIIHKVKGWLNGGASASGSPGKTAFVYVIKPGKQEHGEIAPNDQIAMLRRFSSFTAKEDTPIVAVFPGRPTRKVPDGASQDRVTVRYSGNDGVLRVTDQAVKESSKTHTVVVVTDHPEVEKQARSTGCTILGTTTFEKALEAVAGGLPRESRDPRPPREPRDSRKPQEEPAAAPAPADDSADAERAPAPTPAPAPMAQAPRPPSRKAQYEPSVEKKDKAILDLIDPL